ncbi:MAG: hypothetical protein OXG68_11515 [Chloroflexi bacterium]|nr:hypothetical protein [Chloroflexota bacterium]
MIVSVLQENMKKALDLVVPFLARPAPLPVLANVLLEAEDSRLKISATDLQSSISDWIGARREQPGAITIDSKTIKDCIAILAPSASTSASILPSGPCTSAAASRQASCAALMPTSSRPSATMKRRWIW